VGARRIVDGVDLSHHAVGDVIELSTRDAEMLVAEGWAVPDLTERRGNHERRAYPLPQLAASLYLSADAYCFTPINTPTRFLSDRLTIGCSSASIRKRSASLGRMRRKI
jgi:hypothetical protein